MFDRFGREIDYLRISITDRCNLRCRYCRPEEMEALPVDSMLTYEEIRKIVTQAAGIGIRKLKITGGEPLVRQGSVAFIASLKEISGIEQVTLTTNGLCHKELVKLQNAGIDGINISLDTLDREKYRFLTGYDGLLEVLSAIDTVMEYGIRVKINAVCVDFSKLGSESLTGKKPDRYEDVRALAELTKDRELVVRFIELMPIGWGRAFPSISHAELMGELNQCYPEMTREKQVYGNGPAVYYRIAGYKGRIGLISAIGENFCERCNRLRLTADGFLKSCLCYDQGVDLKAILRSGNPEEKGSLALREAIQKAVFCKPASHCFLQEEKISEKKSMSAIGG